MHCIKYCLSSTGPLPDEIRRTFEKLTSVKLREAYSLKELSTAFTANPFEGKFKTGTIWMSFPNIGVKIVDSQGKTLGINEIGDLVCRGSQMMKDYYKR